MSAFRFDPAIRELKRRRVFRVAAVYAVVAWVMVEVAATVFPLMRLPAWAPTLVVGLAIVGFPVALVLAWAFELTPEGVQRTSAADRAGGSAGDGTGAAAPLDAASESGRITRAEDVHVPPRPRRSRVGIVAIVVVTAVFGLATYGLYDMMDEDGAAAPAADAPRSIAVLPFVDMSAEGDQAYFADGLAEELLNALAQLEPLKVAARTSSFRFRGEDRDVREIGSALGVRTLLEGSVRRAGDRVRITAQLIDSENGYHLWSETYDRALSDLFAVQDEIARSIVDALEVELLGADTGRLVRSATESPRAHDLYLLGLYHWHRRGAAALDSALAYFRRAIDADPSYAPAYAGIANTWAVLPVYDRDVDSRQALERGTEAARMALALRPDLPEAHAALAQLATNFEWDWSAAERHARRALARNPNYATAHQWYAELLYRMGRMDEARREIERALDLDPLSAVAHWFAGGVYFALGRAEASFAAADRALELEPGLTRVHLYTGMHLLSRGRYAAGSERLARLGRGSDESEAYRTIARASSDPALRPDAVAAVDALASGRWGPPWLADGELALLYVVAGAPERALDRFESAYRRRAPNLPVNLYLAAELRADLREQPRFAALVDSMALDWILES